MIKIDIDMPMTCEQCRFYDEINYDGRWCLAKYSQIYANSSVERDIGCPLIEEKEGEWIPVSERLPEKSGVYIVTEKMFSIDDRGHKGEYNIKIEPVEYCNGEWRRAKFFEVIAWQPLPQPYKPESEE